MQIWPSFKILIVDNQVVMSRFTRTKIIPNNSLLFSNKKYSYCYNIIIGDN